jgi:hypothetical protein
VGQSNILINKEQAERFARHIYRDIAAYIEAHREEYEEFLLQQKSEEEKANESKATR